ncbi:MAG: hypothetical protein HKL90_06825 [Elusimicrobia bacterium]|nr:hypothetical protein [Elusimicrobiota bacterium]
MGQTIWDVLASCEGGWVAISRDGKVIAHAGSLEEAERLVAGERHRVTFLYSARTDQAGPSLTPEEPVPSRASTT